MYETDYEELVERPCLCCYSLFEGSSLFFYLNGNILSDQWRLGFEQGI
jgi:hypothetical protein